MQKDTPCQKFLAFVSGAFNNCFTVSGTPIIQSPMDQKNLAVLTRVFLQENAWRFLPGGQKSGCNNDVTVLPRWP